MQQKKKMNTEIEKIKKRLDDLESKINDPDLVCIHRHFPIS